MPNVVGRQGASSRTIQEYWLLDCLVKFFFRFVEIHQSLGPLIIHGISFSLLSDRDGAVATTLATHSLPAVSRGKQVSLTTKSGDILDLLGQVLPEGLFRSNSPSPFLANKQVLADKF